MQQQGFELRGSFQYVTVAALDGALASARSQIDDDDQGEHADEWMRGFSRRGATLQVAARLPASADRYLAAEVIDVLARTAVGGVVEIQHGGRCVDLFTAKA